MLRTIALAIGLLAASPALSASFLASYTYVGGGVVNLKLEGELQPDGDTVVLTAISIPNFLGVSGDTPLTLYSFASGAIPPKASLSGELVAFYGLYNNHAGNSLIFDSIPELYGSPTAATFGVFGGTIEPFEPTRWSMALATTGGTVPEPANWAMLITGFGLVGAAARRRRGQGALA